MTSDCLDAMLNLEPRNRSTKLWVLLFCQFIALIAGGARGSDIASLTAATQPTAASRPSGSVSIKNVDLALKTVGSAQTVLLKLKHIAHPSDAQLESLSHAAAEEGDLKTAMNAQNQRLKSHPADIQTLRKIHFLQCAAGDESGAKSTLEHIIALSPHPSVEDQFELAGHLFELKESEAAIDLLNSVVSANGSTRSADLLTTRIELRAAVLATLYGNEGCALSWLVNQGKVEDTSADVGNLPGSAKAAYEKRKMLVSLLLGDVEMRASRAGDAQTVFAEAYKNAGGADRRYLVERTIAAAREAGNLNSLATGWLAQLTRGAPAQQPFADSRLLPLATVLRELGRVDDLFSLWKFVASNADFKINSKSARLLNELGGAAMEAGRQDDAVGVYQQSLELAQNKIPWIDAITRLLIVSGRQDQIHSLIQAELVRASKPQELQQLIQLASYSGCDDLALLAADSLGAKDGQSVEGLLSAAEVQSRHGNRKAVLAALQKAFDSAGGDILKESTVADAFDAYGMRGEAISILSEAFARTADNRLLDKLAWMLEREGRDSEALSVWKTLWNKSTDPAAKRSALQHLLALATKTGTLAPLLTESKAKFAAGTADGNDLSFAVDIYVQANDLKSAAALIHAAFDHRLLTHASMLRHLATLYERCHQFASAGPILRQLVDENPGAAADTLQEVALISMEQNRQQDVEWAVQQIADRTNSAQSRDVLLAGVFDAWNRPADAAKAYRRSIAGLSSPGDAWILWANDMAKVGRAEQAITRLAELVAQARPGDDEAFGVGVDGLLNLRAPPLFLRAARAAAILRAASEPERMLNYELIRDLSDELADTQTAASAEQLGIYVGSDQRAQLLRDDLETSRSLGDSKRTIEIGKTLVNIGDAFPPQVFVELGQICAVAGCWGDADRAFERAIEQEETGTDRISREIAGIYEWAGRPRPAIRIMLQMKARQPYDSSISVRLAGLYQEESDLPQAFEGYLSAVNLILRRATTGVAKALAASDYAKGDPPPSNTTEADQWLGPALTGAIETARSKQQQQRLADVIYAIGMDRLEQSHHAGDRQPPGALLRIAGALRRVSIAIASPKIATEFDRQLMSTWPGDNAILNDVVLDRCDAGLLYQVKQLGVSLNEGNPDAMRAFAAFDALSSSAATTPTVLAAISSDQSASLILMPQLLVNGRLEETRQILDALPTSVPPNREASIPVILAIAGVVHDDDAAARWTSIWIDSILEQEKTHATVAHPIAGPVKMTIPVNLSITVCAAIAWPNLPDAGRRDLYKRVAILAAGSLQRRSLALLAIKMAESLGLRVNAIRPLISLTAEAPMDLRPADMVMILSLTPSSERAGLLQDIITRIPAQARRRKLLDLVGVLDVELDSSAEDVLVHAVANNPGGFASPPLVNQEFSKWYANVPQNHLMVRLVDALSAQPSLSVDERLLLADARRTLGDFQKADELANAAFGELAAKHLSPLSRIELNLHQIPAVLYSMRTCIGLMSQASRERRASEMQFPAAAPASVANAPASDDTQNTWQTAIHFSLMESLGKHETSLQALRHALQANPGDVLIRWLLLDALEADGRYAEILDILASLPGADSLPAYERQLQSFALTELYRTDELHSARSDPALHAWRVANAAAINSADDNVSLQAGRTIMLLQRWDRVSADDVGLLMRWAPLPHASGSLGGLMSPRIKRQTSAETLSLATNYHASAPRRSWALEDDTALLAAYDAASSNPDAAGTIIDAANSPDKEKWLVDRLLQRAGSYSLTRSDREILLKLATRSDVRLPPPLLEELKDTPLYFHDALTFDELSRAFAAQGVKSAEIAGAWASAAKKAMLQFAPGLFIVSDAVVDSALGLSDSQDAGATTRAWSPRLDGMNSVDVPIELRRIIRAQASGDIAGYRQALGAIVHTEGILRVAMAMFDPGPSTIPSTSPSPEVQDDMGKFAAVGIEVLSQALDQSPGEAEPIRSLCKIGKWAVPNGQLDLAEKALDIARNRVDAGGISEQTLWVADLTRLLGKTEIADQLEKGMLKDECLPAARIAPLLGRLSASGESDEARKLAIVAAGYCHEPALMLLAGRSGTSN